MEEKRWNRRPREGLKRDKRQLTEEQRFTTQETARGVSSSEEAQIAFLSHRTGMRTGCAAAVASKCHPGCRDIYKKRKELLPRPLGHFFKRADRIEPSKEPELSHHHQTRKWHCSLSSRLLLLIPLATTISHHPPPSPSLQSATLSVCLSLMPTLYASYCVVVPYFSRYYTIKLNMFSLFPCSPYVLFV